MIGRPTITRWSFTRMSDGALYTKKRVVDAILSEVRHSGTFNASRIDFGLGITGYECTEEFDKAQFVLRNQILQLKLEGDKIVVTTANYNEYYISEDEMESWFEILKEAREHAKTARAEAKLAQILAKKADARSNAVEQKVPSLEQTETLLSNNYDALDQIQRVIWAT